MHRISYILNNCLTEKRFLPLTLVYKIPFYTTQFSAFVYTDSKINTVKILQKRNAVFARNTKHALKIPRRQDILAVEKIMQHIDQMVYVLPMYIDIVLNVNDSSQPPQVIVRIYKFLSIHFQRFGDFCGGPKQQTIIHKSFFYLSDGRIFSLFTAPIAPHIVCKITINHCLTLFQQDIRPSLQITPAEVPLGVPSRYLRREGFFLYLSFSIRTAQALYSGVLVIVSYALLVSQLQLPSR